MAGKLVFNQGAWDEVVKEVIDTKGVEMMGRVAAAANSHLANSDVAALDRDGYFVSVQGPGRHLMAHKYRATVIAATDDAAYDNAKNNTLIKNMSAASE